MEPMLQGENQDESDPPSRRAAIVAVLVIAGLLIAGLLLAQHLRRDAALQDCLAAGRNNCVRVSPGRP